MTKLWLGMGLMSLFSMQGMGYGRVASVRGCAGPCAQLGAQAVAAQRSVQELQALQAEVRRLEQLRAAADQEKWKLTIENGRLAQRNQELFATLQAERRQSTLLRRQAGSATLPVLFRSSLPISMPE